MCNEVYAARKIKEQELKKKLMDAIAADKSHTEALSRND